MYCLRSCIDAHSLAHSGGVTAHLEKLGLDVADALAYDALVGVRVCQ